MPGLKSCAAQDAGTYTDKATGIQFGTWGVTPDPSDPDAAASSAFTFGMALPPDALTKDATEYIGLLVRERQPDRSKLESTC